VKRILIDFLLCFSFITLFVSCKKNKEDIKALLAPTNLKAQAISSAQIILSWKDTSTAELGFKIERKTVGGDFSLIGSVGANSNSYTDNGLTKSTAYTYRIFPYNANQNGGYSNDATDTTFPDITSGLVAYYPFSGNAGDSSGNSNHGTVNGATLTSDRFGNINKAYEFNNNTITVPHNSSLGFTQDKAFSVSLWAFRTGTQPVQHLIGKRPSRSGTFNWQIAIDTRSYSGFGFNGGLSFTPIGIITNKDFILGSWIHIVGIYSSNLWKIYENGKLVGLKEVIIFANDSNVEMTIGNSGNYEPFYGKLDDIRIYNRALNQDEINYLSKN
jgi:hypothetical protein